MYRMRSFSSTKRNPLKSAAFVTVKMAALIPIPTASIPTAAPVKAGALRSWRRANRKSNQMDSNHNVERCANDITARQDVNELEESRKDSMPLLREGVAKLGLSLLPKLRMRFQ